MAPYSQSMRTLSTLDLTSARQRRTSGYGRPMHGKHSTTSRIFGTVPCLMTSKEQSSWPRWNPSCYMVQRHGRLLQCKKLGSMAATQVCSGWCSTLHGGIGSGLRSSKEVSLESLKKIKKRRLRMAGHCVRHPELAASNLVLWEPTQGRASRGGQSLTFIDQLLRDTSLKTAADIRTCMEGGPWCLACHRCPRRLDQMI